MKKNSWIILSAAICVCGCSTASNTGYASVNLPAEYNGTSGNEVNGQIPKEKIGAVLNTVLENTDSSGVTRRVVEVVRKPGYRSMVHYMTYAVTTCVLKGQDTLVLEGYEPHTYTAGECYVMPSGIKGYVANDGKVISKLLSYTTMPEGQGSAVMLED